MTARVWPVRACTVWTCLVAGGISGCGGDDASSFEVTVEHFAFETPFGPAHAQTFSVPHPNGIDAELGTDDAVYSLNGRTLVKQDGSGSAVFGVEVPLADPSLRISQPILPAPDGVVILSDNLIPKPLPAKLGATCISATGASTASVVLTDLSESDAVRGTVLDDGQLFLRNGADATHTHYRLVDAQGHATLLALPPSRSTEGEDARGAAFVSAVASTRDGGFIGAGGYDYFGCIPPALCSAEGQQVAIFKFDPAGALEWSSPALGKPDALGLAVIVDIVELSDGAFLATGYDRHPAQPGDLDPPLLALAMRFDADGGLQWAIGRPYMDGLSLGQASRVTELDVAVPVAGGAADVFASIPEQPCMLLRIEADGSISANQHFATDTSGSCHGMASTHGLGVYTTDAVTRFER